MKNILLSTLLCLGIISIATAQNVNWRAFKTEQNHLVHVQTGWDYGLTLGLGYGYKFKTRLPILANIAFSAPAGENLLDDFKTRIGAQLEVFNNGPFSATAKVYSPFRRFENSLVTMTSFGSEFSGVLGYYKSRWFVSGEFGFDKAIATQIKHSELARENYPDIQNGWYVPTAGNYFYGIQTGISFRGNDLHVKAGKVVSQGFKTAPFIPFFVQLGYNRRF
jgi:hypothetical protein